MRKLSFFIMTPFQIYIIKRTIFHLLLIMALAAPFILYSYIFLTKGPADFSATDFAQKELTSKYGPAEIRGAYEIISFTKNSTGSDGIYRIHYYYHRHSGVIICSYDAASGNFILINMEVGDDY